MKSGNNFKNISKMNVKTLNLNDVEQILSSISILDSDVSIKENVNILYQIDSSKAKKVIMKAGADTILNALKSFLEKNPDKQKKQESFLFWYQAGIKKGIKEIKNYILNKKTDSNLSEEDIKKAVDRIEKHKVLSNSHKILSEALKNND